MVKKIISKLMPKGGSFQQTIFLKPNKPKTIMTNRRVRGSDDLQEKILFGIASGNFKKFGIIEVRAKQRCFSAMISLRTEDIKQCN